MWFLRQPSGESQPLPPDDDDGSIFVEDGSSLIISNISTAHEGILQCGTTPSLAGDVMCLIVLGKV